MIFRPDGIVALTLALSVLGGCGQDERPRDATESLREQIANGDTAAARLSLNRLVASGVPTAEIAALGGEAALQRGDLVEARHWLGDGAFSEESAAHGHRMLARLELREGNPEGAANSLAVARAIAPADAEVWADIARLRYAIGNHSAAVDAAGRAVELGPGNPEALRIQGQLIRDAQGLAPAARWFAGAMQAAPADDGLILDQAATLLDMGEIAQALAMLEESGLGGSDAAFLKAVAAARQGDYTRAREELDRSDAGPSARPARQMLVAIIDVERGNWGSAAQGLQRLVEQQPDNGRVHELLAYVLSRSGAEEELIDRYSDKARGPAGSTWLRTLVGRAHEALGDRDLASLYLDLAARPATALVPLRPAQMVGQPPLMSRRDEIRARLLQGDIAEAVRLARALVDDFPNSGDGSALLGDALLAEGDSEGALIAYEKAAKVRRSWPLVLRMVKAMDRSAAARLIAAYASADPANAEAAALAADAQAAAGRWREAAALLDRALGNGMRQAPWVLAARSIAAGELGEANGGAQLAWAVEAHETQRMSEPAIAALLAVLPADEQDLRIHLQRKLQALAAR